VNLHADVCSPADRPAAVAILFQHLSEFDRNRQVEQWVRPGGAPGALQEGLIACKSPAGVVGAMLCMHAPGRVLMAWPPKAYQSAGRAARRTIYAQLFQAARGLALECGARFIQLLAPDADPDADEGLAQAGFSRLTRLLYLRRIVDPAETVPAPPSNLEFVVYDDALRPELQVVLERSYAGSLDCPELNGVRSMDDVVASHAGPGDFDPANWRLARRDGQWVGCLLLTPLANQGALEVAYLAVVPEARGRGLGVELTRQAVRIALERGMCEVVLAVDARNAPALAMYESQGFVPWDAREVYLCLLDAQ
jgi:ribosomal protein S18 acetylase RimI-like enzyme